MNDRIKTFIPEFLKSWLKRRRERRKTMMLNRLPDLSKAAILEFVEDRLGIKRGDTLFIHSSFSQLKIKESAEELINDLKSLVGQEGNLLMPFYPFLPSHEFLLVGKPFDLREPWTSMGALPLALSLTDGARKSIHPTKSVVVWGKDRDFLIRDHHLGTLPFGKESPYWRMTELPHSKVVGLGVSADFLSLMHVAVEVDPDYPVQPYHPDPIIGHVIDHDGNAIDVTTYGHDLRVTSRENIPRFLSETKCPTYLALKFQGRDFYTVEAKPLIAHTLEMAKKGLTFTYPATMHGRQAKRKPI